jgi:hypothetical protein
MPYCTDTRLLVRHAAASAVDAALREIALDDAAGEIDAAAFEPMTEQAHAWLAMHKLASNPDSGLPGAGAESAPVTSRSAGEISVSYAAPASAVVEGLNSSTRYGREFDRIAAKVIHPLTAV